MKGKCVNRCNDGKTNFGETDQDCGGSCRAVRKCALVALCKDDADCGSNVCVCRSDLRTDGDLCVLGLNDADCTRVGDPLNVRCFNHLCYDCSRDADCPRPGQATERRFCVEPLAGGCPPD